MSAKCARWLLQFAFIFSTFCSVGAEKQSLEFRVTFDHDARANPFTGRVYVMLFSRDPGPTLRAGPNWFKPEPFFAVDVKNWKPDEPLNIGDNAVAFPEPLSKLPKGAYYVQAVLDLGLGMSFSAAPGNVYCAASKHDLDPAVGGTVALRLDKVYQEKPFTESEKIKLAEVESKLLSAFHGRPVKLRAGVVLPDSWSDGDNKKYPIVYEIPGFGGTHTMAPFRRRSTDVAGTEMLWVVLDPACPLGHHVFADSANNGPVGRAFTTELLPFIEKKFRAVGNPATRFVTGHSSGGWSSLWLQVTYPSLFGGVWSTAPDPVDFRDFQRIDLTKPGVNMFTDEAGQPRPLARRDGKPTLFYKAFSDMEVVMGHGGQLSSFEAVFSPRGPDGKPAQLWNRRTGAVDAAVAHSWEPYDIRLKLERNWAKLAPQLAGKLHVYMGGDDTFYLEGATKLLAASLKKLGSDAVVEIFPGKDHGSLLDPALRKRIAEEMAAQARRAGS